MLYFASEAPRKFSEEDIIICVRVARADIKMDGGQDAETEEEEETDPGIFCRKSPIRKTVAILRLDFFSFWQAAMPSPSEVKQQICIRL